MRSFRNYFPLFLAIILLFASIGNLAAQSEAEAGEKTLFMIPKDGSGPAAWIRADHKIAYILKSDLTGQTHVGKLQEIRDSSLVIDGNEFPLGEFVMIKARAGRVGLKKVMGGISLGVGGLSTLGGIFTMLIALIVAALGGQREAMITFIAGVIIFSLGLFLILAGILLLVLKKKFDLINEWDMRVYNWKKRP